MRGALPSRAELEEGLEGRLGGGDEGRSEQYAFDGLTVKQTTAAGLQQQSTAAKGRDSSHPSVHRNNSTRQSERFLGIGKREASKRNPHASGAGPVDLWHVQMTGERDGVPTGSRRRSARSG